MHSAVGSSVGRLNALRRGRDIKIDVPVFTRSPGGHPGEPVGNQADPPLLEPRSEMQGSLAAMPNGWTDR